MPLIPTDDNEFIQDPYEGDGEYVPFRYRDDGIIDSYVPPAPISNTFSPPTYTDWQDGNLRITVLSDIEATFKRNDNIIGNGLSATVNYSPARTFNGNHTFKSEVLNKVTNNYFVVSIEPSYRLIDDNLIDSTEFNRKALDYVDVIEGSPTPTYQDYLYEFRLAVKEYTLGNPTPNITYYDDINQTISLNFTYQTTRRISDDPPIRDVRDLEKPVIEIPYEIGFGSNYNTELGDILSLNYKIVGGSPETTPYGEGSILLSVGNTDSLTTTDRIVAVSTLVLSVSGNLPDGYRYKKFYWAPKPIAQPAGDDAETQPDFSKWNEVEVTIPNLVVISTPASILNTGGVVVIVFLEKIITVPEPIITIPNLPFEFVVRESDIDKLIEIPFGVENTDYVYIYLSQDNVIKYNTSGLTAGKAQFSFNDDFAGVFGNKKITFVPASAVYGTGMSTEIIIKIIAQNDFPSVTRIEYPAEIDIPAFSDYNITYNVIYESFSTSTVDIFVLGKNNEPFRIAKDQPPSNTFIINIAELGRKYEKWNGLDHITLILRPYNRLGEEELVGNDYTIATQLIHPKVKLDTNDLRQVTIDSFNEVFITSNNLTPEREKINLTHWANFDNNNEVVISAWERDDWTLSPKTLDEFDNEVTGSDVVKSLILKLYTPLPNDITENTTFWISKILANPLVETVVLTDQDDVKCPPIAGPNFEIEVDFINGRSTNFESIDSLILSTSVSSSAILNQSYLNEPIIDTTDLNIQYVSGSDYAWNNFVKYSSAKERVDNLVYKVQLIENYELLANKAAVFATASVASLQEVQTQTSKKQAVIQGFDGFDKFLYTPSSYTTNLSTSFTWPHSGSVRASSTSSIVIEWYNNISELAEVFDSQNSNWIQANIPIYIIDNEENDQLLLFMSMIGHHFDNLYFFTKAIERSRGISYGAENGIANKLLFDKLKSFSWDPKNLSVDSKLWEYALGLNKDGDIRFESPAKQRTYEIWRRIINNLPFLLKSKGTRKGLYALLACYGVPSYNLSIIEFGGPEVEASTENKGKYEFDVVSAAVVMNTNSSILINWLNTKYSRKPDDIEVFLKPAFAGLWDVVSGSNWGIQLSGSADSKYGRVLFNYAGSSAISSSALPIFNGESFGINVSRLELGASDLFTLDVHQPYKDRTIFLSTSTGTVVSNWENGSLIEIGGGTNGFTGSIDEFRLWSLPLSSSIFYQHSAFPEMINGNSVSASTNDLHFRLDFEFPKNLATYTTMPNIDANIYYSQSLNRNYLETNTIISNQNIFSANTTTPYSASMVGFTSVTEYPYQFEVIQRNALLEIPSDGSTRYSTNKVRFEDQILVTDLRVDSRATVKSFDNAPIDSNRIGVFFSPNKELNIDIAKSFGGIRLDDYIGDPSAKWQGKYTELEALRKYYFSRIKNRNIHEYINLVKLYEKAMFDDIKQILPARAKITTGLLIEPHILERSKIEQRELTAANNQHTANIKYGDTTELDMQSIQEEAVIDADLSDALSAFNYQNEVTIDTNDNIDIDADNYQLTVQIDPEENINLNAESYQQCVTIDVNIWDATIQSEIEGIDSNQIIGQTDFELKGFGIFAQSGSAIRTYRDNKGGVKKERIRAHLTTEQKSKSIDKYNTVISGQGDPRNGFIATSSFYTETNLTIQPYTGSDGNPTSIPVVGGSIIAVQAVDGYLRTHYVHTNDLTRGLQNSFYRGCKNTAASSIDGSDVVEVFVSNPNTLRVNQSNRDSSEPILEAD